MARKFFVIDLNSCEMCDTIEAAREKAEWWMQIERDQCEEADAEELAQWMHSQYKGLDAGDVVICEAEEDDDSIHDYDGRITGRLVIEYGDVIDTYSARRVLEEVAQARGIA